jgi:hypothetical protein
LRGRRFNRPKRPNLQTAAARAELADSNTAIALGVTVEANTPVLELCRKLVAVGHDPATRLDVYRGNVLALRITSIGAAARLEINAKGTGFVARYAVRTASPMRQNDRSAS